MSNLSQNQTIENRRDFLKRALAGAAVIAAVQAAGALPTAAEPAANPEVRGDVHINAMEFSTAPGIQFIIRGQKVILVNRNLSPQDRERFIEKSLHSFQTSNVWKRLSSIT